MKEGSAKVQGGSLYYRYKGLRGDRTTILFLHGLGESGLCFIEAFKEQTLEKYNILVPDLLGYGKSAVASDNDYSFFTQINRIFELLDQIGINTFHLVGHSMGGDIGTKLCLKAPAHVHSFINVEGDLTPGDRFITTEAIGADKENRFNQWFLEDFRKNIVLSWSKDWPSCIRYLASLSMCSTDAFLKNAYEIYSLNEALPDDGNTQIALDFKALRIPKMYCWGAESLSASSRAFLECKNIPNQVFEKSFHWVMLDQQEIFYHFLGDFLEGCAK